MKLGTLWTLGTGGCRCCEVIISGACALMRIFLVPVSFVVLMSIGLTTYVFLGSCSIWPPSTPYMHRHSRPRCYTKRRSTDLFSSLLQHWKREARQPSGREYRRLQSLQKKPIGGCRSLSQQQRELQETIKYTRR